MLGAYVVYITDPVWAIPRTHSTTMSALDSTPTATVVDGALDASAVTTVIEQAVSPTTDGWVNARASSQGSPPTNSPRFRSGSLAQSDASHRHPEPVTKQCEHYLLDYQLWYA